MGDKDIQQALEVGGSNRVKINNGACQKYI